MSPGIRSRNLPPCLTRAPAGKQTNHECFPRPGACHLWNQGFWWNNFETNNDETPDCGWRAVNKQGKREASDTMSCETTANTHNGHRSFWWNTTQTHMNTHRFVVRSNKRSQYVTLSANSETFDVHQLPFMCLHLLMLEALTILRSHACFHQEPWCCWLPHSSKTHLAPCVF